MHRPWIITLVFAACSMTGVPAIAMQGEDSGSVKALVPAGSADITPLNVGDSGSTDDEAISSEPLASQSKAVAPAEPGNPDTGNPNKISRTAVLIGSLTVFMLAVFVGFEVITKVPPTLHTPLMSGSNAISGITVVGALLTAGHVAGGFGSILGLLAVILAMINVVGGFLVTHRMLLMFKKR